MGVDKLVCLDVELTLRDATALNGRTTRMIFHDCIIAVPTIASVQGVYPVSIAQYPVSSCEQSNIQQGCLVDAIRIAKTGPMFESSSTVMENENVSN